MPGNIIADSSALVALLNRDDEHHGWMAAQAGSQAVPWFVCEPALTESFYLVGGRGEAGLKNLLRRRALVLAFNLEKELAQVLALMDKYADMPMSLADACIVRMTETLSQPVVLTTDSDFKIYRRHGRQVLPCLMP